MSSLLLELALETEVGAPIFGRRDGLLRRRYMPPPPPKPPPPKPKARASASGRSQAATGTVPKSSGQGSGGRGSGRASGSSPVVHGSHSEHHGSSSHPGQAHSQGGLHHGDKSPAPPAHSEGSSSHRRRQWGRRREETDSRRRWKVEALGKPSSEEGHEEPLPSIMADGPNHRRRMLAHAKQKATLAVGKTRQAIGLPPSTPAYAGPIKVLTYNVCWGCTCAYMGDRTAMQNDLKSTCMKKVKPSGAPREITQCSLNMARGIKQWSDDVGGYDLIALQEAMNPQGHDPLMHLASASSQYNVIQLNRLAMLSAYKKSVFGEPNVITGGGFFSERPAFLILVWDAHKLIFINFHNDHKSNNGFEQKLMTALDQDAFRKEFRKEYRVILAGDFNDSKGKLISAKIQLPWLRTALGIKKTAPSCCTSLVNVSLRGVGDFILDSNREVDNRIPKLYDIKIAQSDHRPVEAVL